MGWKLYRLVYEAKSPIHIGRHKLGYINRTRYYITGKTIWGAITAHFVRSGSAEASHISEEEYQTAGNLFCQKIRLSYFYPAIDPENPMIPRFTEQGLEYGNYFDHEFERRFIKSYGQTAILPENNTAEDQSLHEAEYIVPTIEEEEEEKQAKVKSVKFVGYIFINDGAEYKGRAIGWKDLENTLREIFVGGDRGHGRGKLVLLEGKEIRDSKVFGHNIVLNVDDLFILISPEKAIPAHLKVETEVSAQSSAGFSMKGDIEAIVGREWGTIKTGAGKKGSGAGERISKVEICWVPGSILCPIEAKEKSCEVKEKRFKIDRWGILEAADV